MQLTIEITGATGSGKSTAAALITAMFKAHGIITHVIGGADEQETQSRMTAEDLRQRLGCLASRQQRSADPEMITIRTVQLSKSGDPGDGLDGDEWKNTEEG